jgi:hypothetical protein
MFGFRQMIINGPKVLQIEKATDENQMKITKLMVPEQGHSSVCYNRECILPYVSEFHHFFLKTL